MALPRLTCPSCRGLMEIDPEDRGYEVECPHCAAIFVANEPERPRKSLPRDPQVRSKSSRSAVERAFADEGDGPFVRPSQRNDREAEASSDSTELAKDNSTADPTETLTLRERPQRRGRDARRSSSSRHLTPEESDRARQRARTCGTWTCLVAYGCCLLHLILGVGLLLLGFYLSEQPQRARQDDAVVAWVFAGLSGILGTLVTLPTILAGHRLRQPDRLTALSLPLGVGIINVILLMMCTVVPTIWGLGAVGIWCMVVASDHDLKLLTLANERTQREGRLNSDPDEPRRDLHRGQLREPKSRDPDAATAAEDRDEPRT